MTTHTRTAARAALGVALAATLAIAPVALASNRPKVAPVAPLGGTIVPPTPTYSTPNPTLWPRAVSGTIVAPTPTYRTPNPTLWPR
jgi:hypothetical protein